MRRSIGRLCCCATLLLTLAGAAAAQAPAPTAAETAELLRREPITLASWPAWRDRLKAWINSPGHQTDAAYEAARQFLVGQVGAGGQLPEWLAGDALAWYLLGSAYLDRADPNPAAGDGDPARAESALRRSLLLDPAWARAHRNLARALFAQEPAEQPLGRGKRAEARKELAEARRLDPKLPLKWVEAADAQNGGRHAEAERLFGEAMAEDPGEPRYAYMAAAASLKNDSHRGRHAAAVARLVERRPDDGTLACLHAVGFALDDKPRDAVAEFDRARRLGADPSQVLAPELVQRIEEAGRPGLLERFGWLMAYGAAFFVAVMALMAVFGLVLAARTRGVKAVELLGVRPEELITEGQVARAAGETGLARLYALGLFAGLVLFYALLVYAAVGLVAVTVLLLWLLFLGNRIPVKLVLVIVLVGGGMAWSVVRSLFARPGTGSFGVEKSAADCPRLYGAIAEVARRVATDPVDQVYLAPGSAIGVHQEGRGPFGVFGVKRRVLTLGLSTMHFLTVSELQAILAHEYAHFSHRDTFYNRFVYQVTLSIQEAVQGLVRHGGRLNYVNPFYWLLRLYYRAYHLLSAGFSRSREFLADRMAVSLYGADVFASALTKVATDGALFEMTIYHNINGLLDEGKAFINMYSAFRDYRQDEAGRASRDGLYQRLLAEKGSLFASHPTFGERVEAVMALPKAHQTGDAPALTLFDQPEEVEKELTEFLTGCVHHMRQLQAQAAAG
jgi:Zn-dependent protease with chaperone function